MSELKCRVPKYHSQVWEDSGSRDIGVKISRPIRIQDSLIYCTVQTAPNFTVLWAYAYTIRAYRIHHHRCTCSNAKHRHAYRYLIDVPNNILDVIICTHIYRIICQLARVFNNQTIRWLAKMFLLQKVIYWPEIWTRWCSQ